MVALRSAGILLYRRVDERVEVFIARMGGPLWAHKTEHSWSIPKGLYVEPEQAVDAALREFGEEIGVAAPAADYRLLGEFRQSSGKIVVVFAAETDVAVEFVESNSFDLEWPPRSGRIQSFPEIDEARWVTVSEAKLKLVKGQLPVMDALENLLAAPPEPR